MEQVAEEMFLRFALFLAVWYNRLKIQLCSLLAEVAAIQLDPYVPR